MGSGPGGAERRVLGLRSVLRRYQNGLGATSEPYCAGAGLKAVALMVRTGRIWAGAAAYLPGRSSTRRAAKKSPTEVRG